MDIQHEYRAEINLPPAVLQKAIRLKNSVRTIFIALYIHGKPATSLEVSKLVVHERAYVNMRLQQLAGMDGYVTVEQRGKTKFFEAIK